MFGDDQQAKAIAHREFDKSYERHFGAVKPMEADARAHLLQLQALGIRLGVLSNRARRFMAHEIYTIDGDGWHELFDRSEERRVGKEGVRKCRYRGSP